MVSKLATFRTDDETWDSFQAKAKSTGTNASALLQKFVRDYLDDKLDNRIDSPAAAPDVDIDSKIADAVRAQVLALREEFEEHERIYQAQCQKGFELQIATFRSEMDEAIATAKKPLLSSLRDRAIAA
jgi:hypothetical protein